MRRLDWRGAIEFVDITRAHASACPIDPATMLERSQASEDGNLLSGDGRSDSPLAYPGCLPHSNASTCCFFGSGRICNARSLTGGFFA